MHRVCVYTCGGVCVWCACGVRVYVGYMWCAAGVRGTVVRSVGEDGGRGRGGEAAACYEDTVSTPILMNSAALSPRQNHLEGLLDF